MNRLTKRGAISQRDIDMLMDYSNENQFGKNDAYYKLKHYEDLEEQERLIVLPCKIGDNYFTYAQVCHGSNDECLEQDDCDECPHLKREIREYKFKNVIHILNAEKEFGKTIFLTREEAEAASSD